MTLIPDSVQFSHSDVSNSLWPHGLNTPGFSVHHQLPELTQTHAHWGGDAMQPFHPVIPFSSRFQSFPASGSFPMSQFIACGGHSIGVWASASVCPINIQDWFPFFIVKHTVKGFGILNKAERCFSGTLLLFPWSSECWQFGLWFLCLF